MDSKREIHTKYGGVLKVYSADAESKHGYSFSAIIFDELHTQPNRRLWDVLTAGSDAARRQQAVIVLTTAGDDPDRKSIGWEIHENCRRILAWRRGEPERELDGDDPAWCPIMYGVSVLTGDDPDRIAALDIYDEAVWYACNPGLGHNLKLRDFRRAARAARQSEAAERLFRWLRLNQWIATHTVGWLPLGLYDKTQFNRPEWEGLNVIARRQAIRAFLRGKRCYGGLDLSTTTDLTALTLLFPPQEGLEHWVTLFWAWRPEEGVVEAQQRDHVPYRDWARAEFLTLCPGDMVDFTMVEETVARCAETFDLDTLGVDPYLSRTLTQRLMDRGVEVVEIPQTIKELSPRHEGGGAAAALPRAAPRAQHGRQMVLRQRALPCGRQRESEAHEKPQHRPNRHDGGLDHRHGHGHGAGGRQAGSGPGAGIAGLYFVGGSFETDEELFWTGLPGCGQCTGVTGGGFNLPACRVDSCRYILLGGRCAGHPWRR